MARPYRDAIELSTKPVSDRRSPLTPEDAVIVTGSYAPGVSGVAPVVLIPGFEYRVRLFRNQAGDEAWVMERRRAAASSVIGGD